MRIVSYNILDGGVGRADPLAEVLLAQRADVIGLVEAEDLEIVERIAARLEMDYIQAIGRPRAAVLMSRWPIVQSINHAVIQPKAPRSFLEATVADPSGREWTVGVVHFLPHRTDEAEDRRLAEAEAVLEICRPYRQASRPHILMGDFNAVSPLQQSDQPVSRRVVPRLLETGYIDSLAHVDPQTAAGAATFKTNTPQWRVDYLFTWGIDPASLKSAWIEQDRLARYASDHYPVGLEIA